LLLIFDFFVCFEYRVRSERRARHVAQCSAQTAGRPDARAILRLPRCDKPAQRCLMPKGQHRKAAPQLDSEQFRSVPRTCLSACGRMQVKQTGRMDSHATAKPDARVPCGGASSLRFTAAQHEPSCDRSMPHRGHGARVKCGRSRPKEVDVRISQTLMIGTEKSGGQHDHDPTPFEIIDASQHHGRGSPDVRRLRHPVRRSDRASGGWRLRRRLDRLQPHA
jgi:hypothetical protein